MSEPLHVSVCESALPFAGMTLTVTAPSRQWMTSEGSIDWTLRRAAFEAAESLGFAVREMSGTALERARFAGSDAVRAKDLMCAATEIESDLIMALRGGYGASRLLDLLDWDALGRSRIPMVGYSDFTAISLALLAKTGRVSWQGPTLRDLIDIDPLTLTGLETILGKRPLAVRWQTTELTVPPTLDINGTLWGGNLAVLTSLVGTPYFPEVENGILFIEDIGESAYRIERMLMTLEMAGVLRRQQAILVGDMKGADRAVGWDGDFCLRDALSFIRERSGLPVVTGLPFGHIHAKCALPVGARVRLTVSEGKAALTDRAEAAR